jgi:tripartite ATP-independent periplasmic transporter solute receptor, DctP family
MAKRRLMRHLLRLTACTLLFATLFTIGRSARAGEKYTMKFCWVDPLDPMKQSTSAYAVTLKSEVERLSGGRIQVELYPAAQLGDQRSCIEQIAKGTLEGCNISSGVLASLYYDKLSIVDMPFLFSSREHAARALDVRQPLIKGMVEECAAETGIRILNLAPFGPRHITNNKRPIRTPDDMKGLKIRTMEIIPHMKLMQALGATPTPIPFIELYTSLQTGVVDGQENPLQNIEVQRFYQVQKYLTISNHVIGIGGNLISEKWFKSLPDDLKVAVVEGDRVAQLVYNGFGALLDAMGTDSLVKHGMEVYRPTAEELEQFKAVSIPFVREYMEEELGKEFVEQFMTLVEQTRESFVKEALE